jgi:ABC-type multidrug transport system fused ATPase/permease subunit
MAAYKPEFKRAENAALNIVKELGKNTTTADSLLAASIRLKLAEAFANYRSTPEQVAIVGRTGHRKSTVISALLGIPDIAISVSTDS